MSWYNKRVAKVEKQQLDKFNKKWNKSEDVWRHSLYQKLYLIEWWLSAIAITMWVLIFFFIWKIGWMFFI